MTDEQIINSLNHLAEQKYLRVASRSVCKHAAERIEQLAAINEELEAKLAKADRLAEVLNDLLHDRGHCFIPNRIAGREDWDEDATEALKDFKGESK